MTSTSTTSLEKLCVKGDSTSPLLHNFESIPNRFAHTATQIASEVSMEGGDQGLAVCRAQIMIWSK